MYIFISLINYKDTFCLSLQLQVLYFQVRIEIYDSDVISSDDNHDNDDDDI